MKLQSYLLRLCHLLADRKKLKVHIIKRRATLGSCVCNKTQLHLAYCLRITYEQLSFNDMTVAKYMINYKLSLRKRNINDKLVSLLDSYCYFQYYLINHSFLANDVENNS